MPDEPRVHLFNFGGLLQAAFERWLIARRAEAWEPPPLLLGKASAGPARDVVNSRREGSDVGVAFFTALYSAMQKHSPLPALVVLGALTIHGNPKPVPSPVEPLQIIKKDNGGRRALIPIENERHFLDVHA